MVKGLKVVMIIWAAVAILVGLAYIFLPKQLGEMGGFEKGPVWVMYILALLGVCFIATGGFVIAAAVRGPLKHLMWVQFAITVAILIVVVIATSIMRGLVTFSQEGMPLIFNAVFAVLLLAFYPWRAKPGN
jgi:hypothetical protein